MSDRVKNSIEVYKAIEKGEDLGRVLGLIDLGVDFYLCEPDGFNMLNYAVLKDNVSAAEALMLAGFSLDLADDNGKLPRDMMGEASEDFEILLNQYISSESEKNGDCSSKDFVEFCYSFGNAIVQDFQYANRYPTDKYIEGTKIKRFQFGITWRELTTDAYKEALIDALAMESWQSRFEIIGPSLLEVKESILVAHIKETPYPTYKISRDTDLHGDLDFHSKNIAGIISFDLISPEEMKSHFANLLFEDRQMVGIAIQTETAFSCGQFQLNHSKVDKNIIWHSRKTYKA